MVVDETLSTSITYSCVILTLYCGTKMRYGLTPRKYNRPTRIYKEKVKKIVMRKGEEKKERKKRGKTCKKMEHDSAFYSFLFFIFIFLFQKLSDTPGGSS